MRFRYTFTLILAAAMALASCTKESRELMYANQETRIESFVGKRQAENPDARVVHNGGATRVVESVSISKKMPFMAGRISSSAVA